MRLYLMRHGTAVDREDPDCPPDAERPLTSDGQKRTREAAQGLKWLDIAPNRVLTSPYTRATQTAGIVVDVLGNSALRALPSEALLPDADPSLLRKALKAEAAERVLCVGHLPHLDLAIAHLLGVPHVVTQLKKAGVVCLDVPASGPATVQWALPPKLLRKLGC